MCSQAQRGCDHPCSGKFRRDRREISGTVRGTQFMPVTLAVFGNQQFWSEHNCRGNTWTGIRRLVGRPVPAIFVQTRSGSQRRGRSFGAPSWNAAEPAIGRAVAEKAIGVGNEENRLFCVSAHQSMLFHCAPPISTETRNRSPRL